MKDNIWHSVDAISTTILKICDEPKILWSESYKRNLCSFSLVTVWLCNFLRKDIGTKAACKMLMKLTLV
jgi:hypothetical protein